MDRTNSLDLIEAVRQRKSIRAFTSEPVSRDVINEILGNACWAPSSMNTQPYEFVMMSGEKLNQLMTSIVKKFNSGASMHPNHLVIGWSHESICREWQATLAKGLLKAMGIPLKNKENLTT